MAVQKDDFVTFSAPSSGRGRAENTKKYSRIDEKYREAVQLYGPGRGLAARGYPGRARDDLRPLPQEGPRA